MRIMHVNKFAYSKGGAEEYMLRLARKQVEVGEEVAVFGSDPDSSRLQGIRCYPFEIADFYSVPALRTPLVASEVLWSGRASRALSRAIEDFHPDVVHLHNYAHQLSSSIVLALRKLEVPSVNTAHDYKLICPAYVACVDGNDCFDCAFHLSTKLVRRRCLHGSLAWSSVAELESLVVRTAGLVADSVIAPSECMKSALENSWIEGGRVSLIRNPAESSGLSWVGGGGYLLYVGRISKEKGVRRLISVCRETGLNLILAGDGPERQSLEAEFGFDSLKGVRFVGHVSAGELSSLRQKCIAQVIPSEWPENAPLAALEAAVDGVPILSSARGGLVELEGLGARIVCFSELDSGSLRLALSELVEKLGDVELVRRELGWEQHLSRVRAEYLAVGA